MQIYVEVEDNDNTYGLPLRTFQTKGEPYSVSQVKMDLSSGLGVPCWVVGWSSERGGTPIGATCVVVEDSGDGVSHLVYGGDWGLRFKPVTSEGSEEQWDLEHGDEFGEPYLLLADKSDVSPV